MKFSKYFKTHKKKTIMLGIFLTFLFVCVILFLVLWFGGGNNKYGNRLDGIDKVPLSSKYLGQIETSIKKNNVVSKVSYNVQGRLVNFIITVDDGTAISDAEALGDTVKSGFTKDELAFYDIQIYLVDSGKSSDSNYPEIGYKHKTSDSFVWSGKAQG